MAGHYRGWLIEVNWLLEWEATGPNYDASWEGEEDGWVGNGEMVTAKTLAELRDEIDAYIEEHPAASDASAPASAQHARAEEASAGIQDSGR